MSIRPISQVVGASGQARLSARRRAFFALVVCLGLGLAEPWSRAAQQTGGSKEQARDTGGAPSSPPSQAARPVPANKEAGTSSKTTPAEESGNPIQQLVEGGIAVEFSVSPLVGPGAKGRKLLEGEEVGVQFKITDTSGSPLTGLNPTAWLDLRTAERPSDLKQCREKIQAFLQGSLSARATVDLNSYHVLALNDEANLSVLDPLRGFGGTKLLSLVPLKDPGEDWVLSRNGRMLFVSMPQANQVAAIETITWKVLANVEAGPKPTQLALQGDGRYLWVSNSSVGTEEGTSEVTVIDTTDLRKVAQIPTGVGPHDVVLTADDRYAFITNRKDGTVSIVDVRTLKKIEDLKTGSLPAAAAFSPLSNAVYVAHEGDGTVVAIDGHTRQVVARLSTKPGLSAIGFAPGGRWGFAVNRGENVVHILDVTKNQLRSTVPVGKEPDQVSFTRSFAYIRCAGSELVYMIPLGELEKGGDISAAEFPGGQFAPAQSGKIALASAVVPAPEPNAVLVANPSDQTIYYYAEGMAAPMGSFQNYRRRPKAVLVVDRSLRETAPGTYRANLLLPASGKYDVAFLLDSPRVVHCFDTSVQGNPALKKKERAAAIQIEPLLKAMEFPSGSAVRLQFKVVDSETKQLRAGLQDVRVLTFLAPGIWQSREWAHSLGEGLYEVLITPPSAGVYYVYWECASLHVQYQQLPYQILRVTEPSAAPSAKNPPKPLRSQPTLSSDRSPDFRGSASS